MARPGASSARARASTKPIRSRSASSGQGRLGPLADAALGDVEDPPQVDRVGRVGQHPQVGQRVLDLAPLVEAGAADQLVGQADSDEHLLQDPGLGVGAVEHGDVARADTFVIGEPVDLGGHEAGLVVLVVRDVADDRRAVAAGGPEVLGLAAGVLGDDRVGRAQDGLGRAVVLLQQDGPRARVVVLELGDVADRGAAEGVDRLVGVADDDQLGGGHLRRTGSDQLSHQDVLRVVGVLVLVDHHVAEPPAVVLGHVGESLQDVNRCHDQVVEVQRVGLAQPLLVHPVGLAQHPLAVGGLLGDPAAVRLLVDQVVLEVGHLRGEAARRVALGVEVELAHDQRHHPLGVGGVVDRERRLEPDRAGLAAQDPHAGRVEGRDPHPVGPRADQADDALAHLARGLVGEGDGEDLAGPHAPGRQQVGDAVGQHPRLARAGAGDDQQRAALVDDRLALLGVEPLEQRGRVAVGRRRGRRVGLAGAADLGRAQEIRPGQVEVGQVREVIEEGAHLPASLRAGYDVGAPHHYAARVATTIPDAEIERALVVVAHPDDVDFGAGGTVATWVDAGIAVTYLICTRGRRRRLRRHAAGRDAGAARAGAAGGRRGDRRERRTVPGGVRRRDARRCPSR